MELEIKQDDLLRLLKEYITHLGVNVTDKDIAIRVVSGRKHPSRVFVSIIEKIDTFKQEIKPITPIEDKTNDTISTNNVSVDVKVPVNIQDEISESLVKSDEVISDVMDTLKEVKNEPVKRINDKIVEDNKPTAMVDIFGTLTTDTKKEEKPKPETNNISSIFG